MLFLFWSEILSSLKFIIRGSLVTTKYILSHTHLMWLSVFWTSELSIEEGGIKPLPLLFLYISWHCEVAIFLFSQHDDYLHGNYSQHGKYHLGEQLSESLITLNVYSKTALSHMTDARNFSIHSLPWKTWRSRTAGRLGQQERVLGSNPCSATCWL